MVVMLPPLGEKPLLVKSWWEGLGSGERLGLLAAHPERIGTMDGVPIEVRDRANRTRLAALAEASGGAPGSGLWELREWIEASSPVNGLRHHLIHFDETGSGRAVVSLGNPDESTYLSVYVPGAAPDASQLRRDRERVAAMASDLAGRDGRNRAAVIRWLDYRPPAEATGSARFAVAGAADLHRFIASLRVTRDGPRARITAIGHSLGATVIGIADRQFRLPVDGMVFLGSASVGVPRADHLSVGVDRVWAARAPGDLADLTEAGQLGDAPTARRFGAQVFACADTGRQPWWSAMLGRSRDTVAARDGYWDPGNAARDNIAAIVLGATSSVRAPD